VLDFNESHHRLQRECQEFIGEHLGKNALDWETAENMPSHVFDDFARANFILPALPAPLPVAWLKRLGIHKMPGGIPVEEWNALHGMIYCDEVLYSRGCYPCI
jgi:acyl-CoA dehydrogenase